MAQKIQFRRGTAAQWATANPTLSAGEMGFETDTLKAKLGNGSLAWADLPYISDGGMVPIEDHGELNGLDGDDHPQYLTNARGDVRYYLKAEVDALVAAAGSGGGGGGESRMVLASHRLVSNAGGSNVSDTTGNGGQVNLFSMNPTIRTNGAAGAYAKVAPAIVNSVVNEGLNLWKYDSVIKHMIITSSLTNAGGIYLGQGDGNWTASNTFYPYRWVGFRIRKKAGTDYDFTIETMSCNAQTVDPGTGWYAWKSTVVEFNGRSYATQFEGGMFMIDRRQDEVKFYYNGDLIATHTENIPNASSPFHQSNHFLFGVHAHTGGEALITMNNAEAEYYKAAA